MSFFSFSSYSSFFLAPPPTSPQKLKFIVTKGKIVTLERTSCHANGRGRGEHGEKQGRWEGGRG